MGWSLLVDFGRVPAIMADCCAQREVVATCGTSSILTGAAFMKGLPIPFSLMPAEPFSAPSSPYAFHSSSRIVITLEQQPIGVAIFQEPIHGLKVRLFNDDRVYFTFSGLIIGIFRKCRREHCCKVFRTPDKDVGVRIYDPFSSSRVWVEWRRRDRGRGCSRLNRISRFI